MNKRIQELADQAKVLDYSTWDSYNQKTIDHYKFDKEKFAQLIAEECIGIVENYPSWYGDYRDQIENAFRGHLVAKMKYHFGVEE